jgi:hypothetical protein
MAADKFAPCVEDQQRKHHWKECGKAIEICRRPVSRGAPEYHHKCWLRILRRHRKARGAGYHTVQQACGSWMRVSTSKEASEQFGR